MKLLQLKSLFLGVPGTIRFGGRAFTHRATCLWNDSLPAVRDAGPLDIFESKLKNDLFFLPALQSALVMNYRMGFQPVVRGPLVVCDGIAPWIPGHAFRKK